MSTFCNVDFSSKSGRERLENTIDQLVTILFATIRSQQAMQTQ